MRQNMGKRKDFTRKRTRFVCPELAAFIIYRCKLSRISQGEIARYAAVSRQMVHQVIWGKKQSAKVRKIIASMLGYADWSEIVLASRGVAA